MPKLLALPIINPQALGAIMFRHRSIHPHFRDVCPVKETRMTDEERATKQQRMDMAMAVTNARLGKIRVCFPAHA